MHRSLQMRRKPYPVIKVFCARCIANPVTREYLDLPEPPTSFFGILHHGEASDRQFDALVPTERILDGIKDGIDGVPCLADSESPLRQCRDQNEWVVTRLIHRQDSRRRNQSE